MRDSPAIPIIERLTEAGAEVAAYDPKVPQEAAVFLPDIAIVSSVLEAATNADCIVIVTEWPEFASLDLAELHNVMRTANIVDARNIVSPDLARLNGFKYAGMGKQ